MLPSLSGIGSDVVLTPGNFQAYPELLFSFFTPGSCVLGCKHQESRKLVALSIIVAPPLLPFYFTEIYDIGYCMKQKLLE